MLLEGVYLLAGNAFLRSEWGRGLINRRPEALSASWASAWTWLPGLVQVEGLELEGASRRVSWSAVIDRGRAWLWLPSLFDRHVRVIGGRAVGVEVDVDPLPRPDTATPPRRKRGWRTTLGGLRIDDLRRLRVGRYELSGSGALDGWARFQARGPMELRLGRLAFDDAVVRSAGAEAARRLTFDASFTTEPYLVGRDDLGTLLAGASGAVELHAEADNLGFLAAYLRKVPWLRLGGFGDLAVDLRVEKGSLLPGSELALTGPEVGADFFDLTARGRGRIEGSVGAGGDGIRLAVILEEYSLERASDGAAILAGRDLETRVSTTSTALYEPPEGLAGSLRLPPARVPDLSVFGRYLPPGLGLRIDRGSADLSADLSYDTVAGSGRGRLAIAARDVTGSFNDAAFSTAVTLRAEMPGLDLLAGRFDVSGSSLLAESTRLERLGVVKTTDWWARVRVPTGRVTLEPAGEEGEVADREKAPRAASIVAELEAEMLDTAPVVVLLEQRLPRLAWFERLLTIPEVELSGTVSAQGTALGLRGVEVTGGRKDQVEIRLDLDLDGPAVSGVAYARYRALDAALALAQGDRDWRLRRARQRYEAAAAEYRASRAAEQD